MSYSTSPIGVPWVYSPQYPTRQNALDGAQALGPIVVFSGVMAYAYASKTKPYSI